MVSGTFEPARKEIEKQQAQQSYKNKSKIQSTIQAKDSKQKQSIKQGQLCEV